MKRALRPSELRLALAQVPKFEYMHPEVARTVRRRLQKHLREQLAKVEIYPEVLPELLRTIKRDHRRTVVSPGESVGIAAAQSIGERQTQLTLNSFHHAGALIDTVVTGVPRLAELLNATRKQRVGICTCQFSRPVTSISEAREITRRIGYKTLKSLSDRTTVMRERPAEPWDAAFCEVYGGRGPPAGGGCVRYELNRRSVYHTRVSVREIKEIIEAAVTGVSVVVSPLCLGIVDVCHDRSEEDPNAEALRERIETVKLLGIRGIKGVYLQRDDNDAWYFVTEGTNLTELGTLADVDYAKTRSNDLWEVYEHLGVEATRQFLIDQFKSVVCSDGAYINERHITLIVDVMVFTGVPLSISRSGMRREYVGPLAKASFEESVDNFLKAGTYGETDVMTGCSASVMCGRPSRCGTGICDLVPNIELLKAGHLTSPQRDVPKIDLLKAACLAASQDGAASVQEAVGDGPDRPL